MTVRVDGVGDGEALAAMLAAGASGGREAMDVGFGRRASRRGGEFPWAAEGIRLGS